MQTQRLPAPDRLRKQKATGQRPILKPSNADLIALDTLGAVGRRKALRFIETGELATVKIGRRHYATRGDLADWEVIWEFSDATPPGEFLGD